MPTSPPAIAAAPPAPQRTDVATFVTRADAFVAWLETYGGPIGTAAAAAYTNAVEAQAAASAAQTAAATAGAALWVSGTTYAIGDVRRSPATGLAYRRLTSGGGTTDPSADATNWILGVAAAPQLVVVSASTVTAQPWGHYCLTNAGATTVTLPAAPAAGDLLWITVLNGRYDNVAARNGKPIMGIAEDCTLDDPYVTFALRFIDNTYGWRLA